ncbi:hypothetical protein GCM10028807_34950 [Spirosoma daeguense]
MKLETEINIALTEFFRPIIAQCLQEAIQKIYTTSHTISPDVEPYGDFNWLVATCAGVPPSTLRIKSAAGEIPGVVKFGKRVLYDKAAVLGWLQGQTRPTLDLTKINQAAELQMKTQLGKRSPKREGIA